MTCSAFENLPDEVLSAIFRHLMPKFARPAHERTNEEDLVYNSHHELWYPLDADDDSDSAGGRLALLQGCLVSKRIKRFAQPVLYTCVTPYSAEYFETSASGGRDFSSCLRRSLQVGNAEERFRHTRTLVVSVTPAARNVENLFSAAPSLEKVQMQFRLLRKPSGVPTMILSRLARIGTLRTLFVELDSLKPEARGNITAMLLEFQQVVDLTIDSPGDPGQPKRAIPSRLNDLYLINASPLVVRSIFEYVETQSIRRLSIIFDDCRFLTFPYLTPGKFPLLHTVTLDNVYHVDVASLKTLPALHTLAFGFLEKPSEPLMSLFDDIPKNVSRFSIFTVSWFVLFLAYSNADQMATHIKTIDLPPFLPEPTRHPDVVKRIVGLVVWRLKMAGITVIPDVQTDAYNHMPDSDLEGIATELLEVAHHQQEAEVAQFIDFTED